MTIHFYQQLSYQEIVQQQEISYDNVCKRISQARKILKEELREYFIGEDKDLSVPPAATESVSEEVSESGGVTECAVSIAVEELQEESVAVVEGFEGRVCEFSLVPILVLMEFDETGVEVRQQWFGGNGWFGLLCKLDNKITNMKKSSSLEKIEEAIINIVSQVSTYPRNTTTGLSANSNFQLLIPAMNWNWEVTDIGITSREQYEFSDHIPQSCKPHAQFSSSSDSFSDNYQAFLEVIDQSFQPEQILLDSKWKLKPPTTPPADTDTVPDGWTKVKDGSGILRWRPDWVVSANSRDWIAKVLGNGGYDGSINLKNIVSGKNNTLSNKQLLFRYRSDDGKWQPISNPLTGVKDIEIYAEAWDRIPIYPGKWYNSSITNLARNGSIHPPLST